MYGHGENQGLKYSIRILDLKTLHVRSLPFRVFAVPCTMYE